MPSENGYDWIHCGQYRRSKYLLYVNQSVLYDVKMSYGTNRYMYSCT
jgi:hypothetical protein